MTLQRFRLYCLLLLRIANGVLNTFINTGTTIVNSITFIVVEGTKAVLNVILAVGGAIVETIQTGAKIILNALNSVGSEVQQFFTAILSPQAEVVARAGQNIIDRCQLLFTIYSPILQFIDTIFRAIQRIGSVF